MGETGSEKANTPARDTASGVFPYFPLEGGREIYYQRDFRREREEMLETYREKREALGAQRVTAVLGEAEERDRREREKLRAFLAEDPARQSRFLHVLTLCQNYARWEGGVIQVMDHPIPSLRSIVLYVSRFEPEDELLTLLGQQVLHLDVTPHEQGLRVELGMSYYKVKDEGT